MWRTLRQALFGWLAPESPLTPEQRKWIDDRFDWLHNEFGTERLTGTVITPSEEFFPEKYEGSADNAATLLDRVCRFMGVDRSRIDLQLYQSEVADDFVAAAAANRLHQGYALGVFEQNDSRITIWLEKTRLDEPMAVVGTLSHEVGHILLLADGRCQPDQPDHEPLTDLLTVFFGFGIFTANSTIRSVNWKHGTLEGWSVSRRGYLSMPEMAYALARYAQARGETEPPWLRHLRPDVRSLLKLELSRLVQADATPAPLEEPCDDAEPPSDAALQTAGDPVEEPLAGDGDEHFAQAEFLAAQGQYAEAIELYTQALQHLPEDWEAWLNRARLHQWLGNHAESIRDATAAIQHGARKSDPYLFRARSHVSLRQYAEALQDANDAVRLDPRDPHAYHVRGIAHCGIGDYKLALRDLDRALDLFPRWAECYLARSRVHALMGNERQAERDLAEAVSRDAELNDPTVQKQRLEQMPPLQVR